MSALSVVKLLGDVSRMQAKLPQGRTAKSSVGVKGKQWHPVKADEATASRHTGQAAVQLTKRELIDC